MDFYPFATAIPYGKPSANVTNAPFFHDDTLTKKAAEETWRILSAASQWTYRTRIILPGVDFVAGAPCRREYQRAAQAILDEGWSSLSGSAVLDVPACTSAFGTYDAGTIKFEFVGC